MKIELFETSAVGTPAYSHAQYGFMKSVSDNYCIERRIEEEDKMAEEEAPKTETVAVETPVEEVVAPVEAKVEQPAEKPVEALAVETAPTETIEQKSAQVDALIATLKDAISNLSVVQRGLVEKETPRGNAVKGMSNGELFLSMFSNKK